MLTIYLLFLASVASLVLFMGFVKWMASLFLDRLAFRPKEAENREDEAGTESGRRLGH